MYKKIALFGALGIVVAGLALAQTVAVAGAKGHGTAISPTSNANGGEFMVAVRKVWRGNQSMVEGRFHWATFAPTPAGRIVIAMPNARTLSVNRQERSCEFSGPATLTRAGTSGPVTINGAVQVKVVDRRHPNDDGELRDLIFIRFVSPTTNLGYTFEGVVNNGDIVVYAREGGGTTGGTTGGSTGR